MFKNKSPKFWWLIAVSTILLVFLLAYHNVFKYDASSSPMDYSWIVRVTHGGILYPPEPYYVEGVTILYMPLYYLLTGNLMKIFGTSPVVGKLVSTVAVFVISLLIYYIGKKLSKRNVLPIIPAVMFAFYPFIVNWAAEQTKIDLLGLMFTTIGFTLALNKKYLWAAIPLVLALFTKQSFVSAPIAIGIYLLLKDRKSLISYSILIVILGLSGLAFGNLLTHGTFVTHVIGYLNDTDFISASNQASWGVRMVVGSLVCLAYLSPVLIIAGYGMYRYKQFGLVGIYLVVSLLVLVITIGKAGSGTNYTFDALVAACCLCSLVLGVKKEGVGYEPST